MARHLPARTTGAALHHRSAAALSANDAVIAAAASSSTTTTTARSAGWSEETRSLAEHLLRGDPWGRRLALSRAVTLLESRHAARQEQAGHLLAHVQRGGGFQRSFRVGIAGAPGAGKSTFIEALGRHVLGLSDRRVDPAGGGDSANDGGAGGEPARQHRGPWRPAELAAICVDPSSAVTGGSILGDKTRMTELSRDARAFVRPAPAQGVLGGLAPRTDDVVRLVASRYPLVLLETVGLGQSELEVQQCVDMLVLCVPPGGGDDLQGVKKGIVEAADCIVVTKADGDLLATARRTAADYRGAMQFLHQQTARGAPVKVLLASSLTGKGLDVVWEHVSRYRQRVMDDGTLQIRRRRQNRYWLWKNVQRLVEEETERDPAVQRAADGLLEELDAGRLPPRVAATQLWEHLRRRGREGDDRV
jgi:LAO/AO transport system kinase